ncbi:hypothetical protein [Gracilimonas mengyeensis]|uniref:Uncharacterized protein n=1 Tax=Gracilimonas mengyeensis TaxID=1302730 RepID=A0A521ARI3_9BACT|nr:hypothetical protein [Gracilimonas mengyeensis]SMO37381.1 hypothetical protein SAMN06265219_101330 [Gracilimonas mengyeensis]
MKKLFIYLIGLIGFLFFEGFARLIILFYHRTDFHFYGVSHLPANIWIVVILLSVLVSTWLVSMLVLTILNQNPGKHAISFAGVLVLWRLFEMTNSWGQEPLWYFLSAIGLHLLGVFLAWMLYTRQDQIATQVDRNTE